MVTELSIAYKLLCWGMVTWKTISCKKKEMQFDTRKQRNAIADGRCEVK